MDKSELLKIAHEKISNMSIKQLEMFCGIINFPTVKVTPLEEYHLNEVVEISTFIPAIGYEFIGNKAIFKAYNVHDNEYAILELYNTLEIVKLSPDRIRKLRK